MQKKNMNLIIVESPTKARTLTKFLNGKYTVEASIGHIRDLPKSELGVEVENNFTPKYVIPKDKKKRVSELKALAAKAKEIILATDPDREGEAIAWHISQTLRLGDKETMRIVFHEITESAVAHAINHPQKIDMKLVDAQQARRVLDRLVGYKLSPLLWQKLSRRWLSAGRVQSVATRLVVEREKEREAFTKEEYWTIEGTFEKNKAAFLARLVSKDGRAYEETIRLSLFDGEYTTTKTAVSNQPLAMSIINDLKEPFVVSAVEKREIKRSPPPAYTTSTIQQDAGRRLSFSAKKTMQTAQRLYEEGFITYHRTDSVNLSDKFIQDAREYIQKAYGNDILAKAPRKFTTKSKVAQEAHEAIRPTDVSLHGADLEGRGGLNRDHIRLYELIWKRSVATQANDARFDATTIRITSANGYEFEAKGSVIVFDGYLRIAGRDSEDVIFPPISTGDAVHLVSTTPTQHFTSPPPRYTEASLVKTLEEKDIGRPSTYASIISTIIDRQYVAKEDRKLLPTDLGKSVTSFLVEYFPDIMNLPFTAKMEELLDKIATGELPWVGVIRDFYTPFTRDLENSYDLAEKVKVAEEKLGELCPDCGHDLVIKIGKYGKFVACSSFPSCKYTRQYFEKIDKKCPTCGGDIVIKKTRTGKMFYGCGNYPSCTFAAWKKEEIQ
jgi:DNA topoisomerase-1